MKDEYIPWGFTVIDTLQPPVDVDIDNEEASEEQLLAEQWDNTVGKHPWEMLRVSQTRKVLVNEYGLVLTDRDIFELDLSVTEVTEQDDRPAWESAYNPADGWGMKPLNTNFEYVDKEYTLVCSTHFLVFTTGTKQCPWDYNGTCSAK
jgi:hypothetical protein